MGLDVATNGGYCHAIISDATTATSIAINGHTLNWYTSTEWNSVIYQENTKGTSQTKQTLGFVPTPPVNTEAYASGTIAGMIITAYWYQPRETTA